MGCGSSRGVPRRQNAVAPHLTKISESKQPAFYQQQSGTSNGKERPERPSNTNDKSSEQEISRKNLEEKSSSNRQERLIPHSNGTLIFVESQDQPTQKQNSRQSSSASLKSQDQPTQQPNVRESSGTSLKSRDRLTPPAGDLESGSLEPPTQSASALVLPKPRKIFSIDFGALRPIDAHVMITPEYAATSIESLVSHLILEAKTDLEKIRAAYKWITRNISYDVRSLKDFSKRLPNDAESVLRNRTCVCEGYAVLMKRLCLQMNIECELIIGYSRGDSSDSANFKLNELHAWNAVKVDGDWRLVECTWGAGYVEKESLFVRKETDFFFLTDPAIFIEDHLPCMDHKFEASKKWQLLDDPIDFQTFVERPSRRRGCFEHQVELVSHNKQALIQVEHAEVTLKFRGIGKPLTYFCAKFVKLKNGEKVDSGKYIASILSRSTNEATVTARPPTTDTEYELQVFGTTVENATRSDCLVSYRLISVAFSNHSSFPDFDGHYGLNQDPQSCGFPKDFCANQNFWTRVENSEYELKIPIPNGATASASVQFAEDSKPDNKLFALEITNEQLTVHCRLSRIGFYLVNIYFNISDSAEKQLLARFLVECSVLCRAAGLRQFPDIKQHYGIQHNPDALGLKSDKKQRFYINPDTGEHEITFTLSGPLTRRPSFDVTFSEGNKTKSVSCVPEVTDSMLLISLLMDRSGFYIVELHCDDFGWKKCVARFLIECTNPMKMSRRLPDSESYDYYGVFNDPEQFGFLNGFHKGQRFWLKPETGQHELQFPIVSDFNFNASATMKFSGEKSPDKSSCALEITDKFVSISLLMSRAGFYELKLSCRDDGYIKPVARFLIECTRPLRDPWKFPDSDDHYGVYSSPERFGFRRGFCTDRRFRITAESGEHELRLPITRSIYAQTKFKSAESGADNDSMSFVEIDGEFMKISLRMFEAGFHKLDLFCEKVGLRVTKADGSTSYKTQKVASFLIECLSPMEKRLQFPISHLDAMDERVLLLEPRHRQLQRNTEVSFRLTSPSLNTVVVNDQVCERSGELFTATIKTGSSAKDIRVYGSANAKAPILPPIFTFQVV